MAVHWQYLSCCDGNSLVELKKGITPNVSELRTLLTARYVLTKDFVKFHQHLHKHSFHLITRRTLLKREIQGTFLDPTYFASKLKLWQIF